MTPVQCDQLSRRRFLKHSGMLAAGAGFMRHTQGADSPRLVAVGESFDAAMKCYLKDLGHPGGALAVMKDGRLVYARGYGWADREQHLRARENSLFRIASLSKPITAVAVLRLAQEGKLDLDDRPFELLGLAKWAVDTKSVDPRWKRVTARHLLQHTGGWDRDQSFDPMFRPERIAKWMGVPGPAGPIDVIRYMLDHSFDFDPGQRYAYSNFGYCLLGRVIEKVTGETYEAAVRRSILDPVGMTHTRLGATLESERAKGEVRYYTPSGRQGANVFPGQTDPVPAPYGGFYLEAMDAHGGWISSAPDLVRFLAALHHGAPAALLDAKWLREMVAPPPAPAWRDEAGALGEVYYGCGWMTRRVGRGRGWNTWHMGSLPGTTALLVHRFDGIGYAALFNQRSERARERDRSIDPILYRAASTVTKWP